MEKENNKEKNSKYLSQEEFDKQLKKKVDDLKKLFETNDKNKSKEDKEER